MLHISRNVWSLNIEHWAKGGLAKFIKNGKQPIQRRIQFPESDCNESWKFFWALFHVSEMYLAWPRRVLSAFSFVRSLTECWQLFRTVLHLSQICGLLHFPESDWKECWGNYSGLWSTCPRLVAWPRLVLCAFSTLTSARLGTRCTLFLQDSNTSPSNARNQLITSVRGIRYS